jgi:hypothetical protein
MWRWVLSRCDQTSPRPAGALNCFDYGSFVAPLGATLLALPDKFDLG